MNARNNKFLLVVVGLFVCLLLTYKGRYGLIDTVANQVIQKVQKDYSPSPYGPGFDPDKVDVIKMGEAKPSTGDWK